MQCGAHSIEIAGARSNSHPWFERLNLNGVESGLGQGGRSVRQNVLAVDVGGYRLELTLQAAFLPVRIN